VNFDNPTGNRSSGNFMVPIAADSPRALKLGARVTF
jgi:hypothetical protein